MPVRTPAPDPGLAHRATRFPKEFPILPEPVQIPGNMEEIEDQTEHLQESIHEEAEEKRKEAKERWTLYVALSTAFIAVLAAVAGLQAGHHSNEALIDRVKASDQWSYYQSKSIKSELAASTGKILQNMAAKPEVTDNSQTLARYEKEKEDIKQKAEEFEKSSEVHLDKHVTLAKAVTIFQIAIAISAIAILTRRKMLWYGGILMAGIGIYFLVLGILTQ
jgi:hypothetical protein